MHMPYGIGYGVRMEGLRKGCVRRCEVTRRDGGDGGWLAGWGEGRRGAVPMFWADHYRPQPVLRVRVSNTCRPALRLAVRPGLQRLELDLDGGTLLENPAINQHPNYLSGLVWTSGG